MESRRAGQINAAHDGQGVEELWFELPTLISGDGLRATEASYPSRQQGFGYRLCCDVRQGNGFQPVCKVIYCRGAVYGTVWCREWANDIDVNVLEPVCRQSDVSQRCDMPGYLQPLARHACSCPCTAVLHARPHEISFAVALVPRWLIPCRFEHLPPEGCEDVGRCFAADVLQCIRTLEPWTGIFSNQTQLSLAKRRWVLHRLLALQPKPLGKRTRNLLTYGT